MPKRSEGPKIKWFEERGAFYVTWTEGRRSRKCSTGATSREEAEIFLAEWLQQRVNGKPVRASDPAKVLITDCLAAYAEEHGPNVMGQETMARALSHLIDFWHGKSVDDISPKLCSKYCESRGVGNGTVRGELTILRAAINWCHKHRRITAPVTVELPPEPTSKVRWLARDEVAKLIRAARTPEAKSYMPRFILLGIGTGRRKEAMLNLRWPMVDLKANVIDFELPGRKLTKKRRGQCPIPAKLLPHLVRAKARSGDLGYVINREGQKLGDIKKGFAAAVRRAGLGDDVTPHTLKHTAITWRLLAGVSIYDVSKLFATSIKTIEKTYGHISPEAMQNAANSMVRNGAQKGAQRASIRLVSRKSA